MANLKTKVLGRTGIEVTELCFGVLPMGPSQFGLDPEVGGRVILEALERGVTFLDTAQSYRTYPHIRHAFNRLPDRGAGIVVSTKSHAKTEEDMKKAVEEARRELGKDVIDIMLLHAAREDTNVFSDRKGALDALLELKAKNVVRAVGLSTHSARVVKAAKDIEEIDIIFPIINVRGLGILHGTREDMVHGIEEASLAGKGLFAMKALGGGNLLSDRKGSLDYVRNLRGISSVAVGMVNRDELEMNLLMFEDRPVPDELAERTKRQKQLIVQPFCIGCGTCVSVCPNFAMVIRDSKAVNDKEKCILCGYCAPVCPQFAIRLV